MVDQPVSVASTLSWNTFLSRTSISSLSAAVFPSQGQAAHGLSDVIRAVRSLNLPRHRYEDFSREEVLGEGETFLVERCVARVESVVAVKHLKLSGGANDQMFHRRLRSVILELQIMRHPPLKAHPNITPGYGYGWNTKGDVIMPFIVVEFASLGTMREHLQRTEMSLAHIEILLGDIASGLAALHTCGIVHGDIKLDNVLMLPSMDRPAKVLAKITDFGHALILSNKSKGDDPLMYAGTLMYNAPEVKDQLNFPIQRPDLPRCDIWSFGLLIWEACIRGEEYPLYLRKRELIPEGETSLDNIELLKIAKQSIKGMNIGPPMFLRMALHKTLQRDPTVRASHARELPLYTRWNASNSSSLQAHLALHIEAPSPTYEVFRLDNGRDISWAHQRQIFQSLQQTYNDNLVKDRDRIIWQMALCYHIGFGTPRDHRKAGEFARTAKERGLGVAEAFSSHLDPEAVSSEDSYSSKILSLFKEDLPPIVKVYFDRDASADPAINDPSVTEDGFCCLHWLWAFPEQAIEHVVDTLLGNVDHFHSLALANMACISVREADSQWPLQLLGSPLAVAISVNSLPAVKALLRLGASPFAPAYGETQFPPEDPRLEWTPFHIAARYHCADILEHLINHTHPRDQSYLSPLGCALVFSTSLERIAMHGALRRQQLERTVQLIQRIQSLTMVTSNGMTPLMQAIDFQDHDVAASLLAAQPELAATPFRSPRDHRIFNYPIHFAVQISSQRDVQETLELPKLIDMYIHQFDPSTAPARDSVGRTPLHLAATGDSSFVAVWILKKRPGLLHVEDEWGRPPLHYCASPGICEMLLKEGSNVDHADKLGMTALHRACLDGASDLVTALLKAKPNLSLNNNNYGTPLHCGVISGSVDVVVALIDAGASVDAIDKVRNTPAHVAAKLDRHQIMRILIRNKAMMMQNKLGRDPTRIALDEGRLGSVGILRILRPDLGNRANQHILDFDPDGPHPTQGQRSHIKEGKDFLWDKDEVMARTQGLPGQTQDESELREIIEEETMVTILSTTPKLFTRSPHPWELDPLVGTSLAFAHGMLQADTEEAVHAIAKTAHDFAVYLTARVAGERPWGSPSPSSNDVGSAGTLIVPLERKRTLEEAEESTADTDAGNDQVSLDTASISSVATVVNCPCGSKSPGHWRMVNLMVTHLSTLWLAIKLNKYVQQQGTDLRDLNTAKLEILAISALDDFYTICEAKQMGDTHRRRSFFVECHQWLIPGTKRPSEQYSMWKSQRRALPVNSTRRQRDDWHQINEEREWRKSRKAYMERTGEEGWPGDGDGLYKPGFWEII